jgi:hypothetical protein
MRTVLRVIGWVLIFGALANGAMALFTLAVVAQGGFSDFGVSVETMIRERAPFLQWTKGAAGAILPPHVADFFFLAPALVVFPLRAIIAGVLGAFALRAARRPAPG